MDESENKYLQKVNLEALQKETGMTLAELANLAKIGPKVIYKWRYMHKDSSRPDYNAIVRLFEKGASVETLFGVEYKKSHLPYNPEFQEGVQIGQKPMTRDEVIALFKSMKEKGEI